MRTKNAPGTTTDGHYPHCRIYFGGDHTCCADVGTRTYVEMMKEREDAMRQERERAPKDEDGYPIQRGIEPPVHLDLLPRATDTP